MEQNTKCPGWQWSQGAQELCQRKETAAYLGSGVQVLRLVWKQAPPGGEEELFGTRPGDGLGRENAANSKCRKCTPDLRSGK